MQIKCPLDIHIVWTILEEGAQDNASHQIQEDIKSVSNTRLCKTYDSRDGAKIDPWDIILTGRWVLSFQTGWFFIKFSLSFAVATRVLHGIGFLEQHLLRLIQGTSHAIFTKFKGTLTDAADRGIRDDRYPTFTKITLSIYLGWTDTCTTTELTWSHKLTFSALWIRGMITCFCLYNNGFIVNM